MISSAAESILSAFSFFKNQVRGGGGGGGGEGTVWMSNKRGRD